MCKTHVYSYKTITVTYLYIQAGPMAGGLLAALFFRLLNSDEYLSGGEYEPLLRGELSNGCDDAACTRACL